MIALDTSALEERLAALEAAVERISKALESESPVTTMTRRQAAAYVGIGLSNLDEAIRRKELIPKRSGRRVLLIRKDVDAWLAGDAR